MKTVKVDLTILQKYFSKDYDFENNRGMFFSKDSYDIETNVILCKFLPEHQHLSELCSQYNIKEFTDIFLNLFFISFTVNHRWKNVSPKYGYTPEMDYKTQLFTLFDTIFAQKHKSERFILNDIVLVDKYKTRNLLSIDKMIIQCNEEVIHFKANSDKIKLEKYQQPVNIQITDKNLLDEMQLFIIDKVAIMFFNVPFYSLLDTQINKVLIEVKQWLTLAKTAKKGGAKTTGHFLKIFVVDILNYLDKETILKDNTRTYKFEFIGKLFEIYGLTKPTQQTNYSKMIFNIKNAKD